ncbi:hypothetical protein TorRG33x02_331810 [Trema orientale]|uniref:Uncharacterized protein n=1 Tax=Trema orientale TaxID=63057 RepID=A0A2P5B5N0_TREOI|nr:hypothetical protein TorRG33x02_331810 [Trema orientale]
MINDVFNCSQKIFREYQSSLLRRVTSSLQSKLSDLSTSTLALSSTSTSTPKQAQVQSTLIEETLCLLQGLEVALELTMFIANN